MAAQVPELKIRPVKLDALTINDGLSQGMINCIYQDSKGFMWFGTLDGLNRYDGYHFTAFFHDANNPYSISGNFITSIFEDSKHRMWIGTALNGLNVFDRNTEKFYQVNGSGTKKNALSDNKILSIKEDPFGNIWVGTSYGLNRISFPESSSAKPLPIDENLLHKITIQHIVLNAQHELYYYQDETGKDDYFEPSFFIDSKNLIWVSTATALFQIHTAKNNALLIQKLDENKYVPNGQKLDTLPNRVFNYAEDTLNKRMVLLRNKYLTIIEKNGNIHQYDCGKANPSNYRSNVIVENNFFWIAAQGTILQFDLNKNIVYKFASQNSDFIMPLKFSSTVFKDKTGTVWIGTKGYGILTYNPRIELFNNLNTGSITWLSCTPQDNIIYKSSQLFLLSRTKENLKIYATDSSFFKNLKKDNSFHLFDYGILTKNDDYWFYKSFIYQFSPSKNLYQKIENSASAFPIFADEHANIYYGSEKAFCKLPHGSHTPVEYNYPELKSPNFSYKFLQAIYKDSAQHFWLGTLNGLFEFQERTNTWKKFVNIPGDSLSLSENVIFSICPDPTFPNRFLWLGTNGGGLNLFEKASGKTYIINNKNGLPNNVIYGILTDKNGCLWMSSNRGLIRFKPNYNVLLSFSYTVTPPGEFTVYTEQDGLQSNEFNRNAFAKTSNGLLFFGGVNGINYFDPEAIDAKKIDPPVRIIDFKIMDHSLQLNPAIPAKGVTLSQPIYLTNHITLPYQANIFTIEFAAMDFAAVNKNLFEYRLKNFNNEWIFADNKNTATFTNLDPGKYVFEVRIKSKNTESEFSPTTLSIQILPPWYMTWWFRLSVLTAIVLFVFAFNRFRYTQKLELLKVRNRIATDLHDEIGSTLSGVFIYSEVAKKSIEENTHGATGYLNHISADVAKMIDALSDIVWTVNSRNDRFENIINRMRAAAIELFEAKSYHLHLNFDESVNALKLGMDDRKNFYLFFKETINNIAKYANGQNVWIDLQLKNKEIVLTVKDDGKGFKPDEVKKGNGLNNLKSRTQELNGSFTLKSAPEVGTEIILSFPIRSYY